VMGARGSEVPASGASRALRVMTARQIELKKL